MGYFLGIITGLLISLILIVLEVYLNQRNKNIVKRIVQKTEKQILPQVRIFIPKDEPDQALDDYIKKSDAQNKDIKLDDII
ncbi:MAG: hypothetical protein WCW77_00585 [Patescibacteria group bacterium]|jgi:hypothetical protein